MDAVGINTSDPVQAVEGMISTVEICRVCLLGNLAMRDLFHETKVASLSDKAMSFANVKMLPGDGLPARVCYICADKLESAYEFKLQVEQADTVLRERFLTMTIKEELFFNEVEVHLEPDRNENIGVIHTEMRYQTMAPLDTVSSDDKSMLKDELSLLQVEKLTGAEHVEKEQDETSVPETDYSNTVVESEEVQEIDRAEETVETIVRMVEPELRLKCTNGPDAIPTDEHDYILHQECMLPEHAASQAFVAEESYQQAESAANEVDTSELPESEAVALSELPEGDESIESEEVNGQVILLSEDQQQEHDEHEHEQEEEDEQVERVEMIVDQDAPQNETRRSKRKLARRTLPADRDSDEENYFENLNLSSRLKKVQADKSEKIFFLCYLCDKQFVSKDVLKEHMHSHEEVRRALLLKKTPEKSSKSPAVPAKMPPSGKRANKCPHCGKEYLYIISFCKHLKQHEREKTESKDGPMPLEVSFHEDDHSLNLDSDSEYRKRRRREEPVVDQEQEEEEEEEEAEDEEEDGKQRKRHRTETYACDKCFETFSTRRALQKHAVAHIDLKCSVCDEEFSSLEKLRNHRTKHVVEGVLTEQDLEEDAKRAMEKEQETYISGERERSEEERQLDEVQLGADEEDKDSTEIHSAGSYSCKVCWQRFAKKEQLQRHAEQHARVKSYKCTQCNKSFGNELTLRNHLIATNHKTFMHGQEYDPNKRIKRVAAKAAQKIIDKIKTEDGLEDYEDEDDDETEKKRSDSDSTYTRKRDSQKKWNYKKDQLECAACNRKCSSKQSLAKHMEQHVKEEKLLKMEKAEKSRKSGGEKKDLQKSVGHEATDNNETSATGMPSNTGGIGSRLGDDDDDDNSDFESGLDWPMDNHECTTCKKRYSTKKSLLRHQLLHEEPNFECDICNVKFYRKDKLKAHYDKCSEKNPDQVRKCNICGDSFENNEILREHRSKHVTEGILTEEDLRDIEPRPEEKKQGEKIGRKRRTDIVGLECTECNKHYTSRKGLLRHIQVHEGKKYLCDICPKKFYRREHLKIHVAKHNMIKPYKCTRCTKRFIKEEQLTNHLSKHDRTFKKNKETDSSKRFLCEICSKSFTQSTTLIAHLRAHNGIKPYVCEVCSRPFTTNAYLKMHMRTHTQERPYICQYCSRAFARADTLANHLTSHTGEAKYHCKYCPKNFRRLKSLKEHVFIHTGQRPYACPTCDRRFNNNGSRYAHSKRCKQNFVQNQNRAQAMTQVQPQNQQRITHQTLTQGQVVKAQNIKTITIARQPTLTTEPTTVTTQQVMQHQEILMPLILPLTVTLTDVGEEVILPEGTKIFTTS